MHRNIKRALWGVAIAGGMTLIGASAAGAVETDGEDGILSGTQIQLPLSIPVNIIDNAISLLGDSSVEAPVQSEQPAAAQPEPAPAPATTDGSNGIGSGSQAIVEITVPITVSGDSIAVLGDAESTAVEQPAQSAAAPAPAAADASTSGEDGLLSGTQGLVSVAAPVTVTGNAIAVLGESGVSGTAPAAPVAAEGSVGDQGGEGQATTDGSDSLLGGAQVLAPVAAPVTVTGNAISLLGESSATSTGGGTGAAPAASGDDLLAPVTSGLDGLLGGTQVAAPISIPVTVGGNAISVLGESTVTEPVPTVDPGPNPGTDPGPLPGTDPGPNPGSDPGTVPAPTVVPAVTATGADVLATTGTAGAGALPLILAVFGLLLGGGLLLRRRAA